FVETMELFEKAKLMIENIANSCSEREKAAVGIEKMRFDYGYLVMSFLFHLVKLRKAHQNNDKAAMNDEFQKTEYYRGILEPMTRPIEDEKYECTPWLNDAFNATWVASRYLEYIKKIKEILF
ncbi:MAG: hypothetical protein JXQ23_09660, partial [Clostridia bacterium]|nr:hypothetical protein [Clostridia bacterium]